MYEPVARFTSTCYCETAQTGTECHKHPSQVSCHINVSDQLITVKCIKLATVNVYELQIGTFNDQYPVAI